LTGREQKVTRQRRPSGTPTGRHPAGDRDQGNRRVTMGNMPGPSLLLCDYRSPRPPTPSQPRLASHRLRLRMDRYGVSANDEVPNAVLGQNGQEISVV
jgi:hypothetical protein